MKLETNEKLEETPEKKETPEKVEETGDKVEKPKKQKKERKPMTEERKARLLENLKKGRETAKLNSQKRAEYKKILKQNEKKKIDDVLIQDLEKRNNKKNKDNENEKLKKEIE